MKRNMALLFLIAALLVGCGPAATPEPTVDANATVQAVNATMVSAILTAQPTKTPLPTGTPTPIPPTDTPVPSVTPTVVATTTATSVPVFGCIAPNGTTQYTAPFKIENLTKSTVETFFSGLSYNGDHPVTCSYELNKNQVTFFPIMWGNYKWIVQVGSKKTFSGSFYVNDYDKIVMQISDKKVSVGTGP